MRLGLVTDGGSGTNRPTYVRTILGLTSSVIAVVAAVLIARIGLDTGPTTPVWFSTAIALGVLLLVPRRQFLLYWLVLFSAAAMTTQSLGGPALVNVGSQVVNALVVLVAATFSRKDQAWIEGDTERVGSWIRFTVSTVLIPFTVAGILHAGLRHYVMAADMQGETYWTTALTYIGSRSVAAFLLVPMMLRLRPGYLRRHRGAVRVRELTLLLVLLAGLTVVVMIQSSPVLLFLLPVPMVVLAVRMGIIGATSASLVVVMPVVIITATGSGPFLAVSDGHLQASLLWAQLFLILVMAANFLIVALRAQHRPASTNDEAYTHMYRLFAESTDELISLVDLNGRIRYISPTALRGEGPGSIDMTGHRWSERIHPADLPGARTAVAGLLAGDGTAHVLSRFRHRNGGWRWYDCRLRLTSTPVEGIERPVVVVAAHDVTDEKTRELELERQNQALATAADTDPLTRLPNRRRLARAQAQGHAAAVAASEPLSLLVVDIDHFKAYNDENGHARGDQALVAVADAIRSALHRTSDVAARYGGEEFVVLLPRTDAEGAHRVAESLCREVRRRRIAQTTVESGMVTVSVGIATAYPTRPDDDGRLFAAADAALYRAKALGRSRIEVAPPDDGA